MACGEAPSAFVKQMQVTMCQLCGKDMQSCCQQEQTNYQKQVDPPANNYTQILSDSRYDEDEESERRKKGKSTCKAEKAVPLQFCVQIPVITPPPPTSTSNNSDKENKPCLQSPKPIETKETQKSESGSSPAKKASCLPSGNCPPPVKMMLCLPCPPPPAVNNSGPSCSGGFNSAPRGKPTDYTYRCESRELRGGNLYQCCQCNKRNGLQHDCPRTPCQGRPACLVKPWPDCWPSGGCHGIDYTREKGTKRVDPCRMNRFDKKECKPGVGAQKSDFGGNMMVVLCPPPNCPLPSCPPPSCPPSNCQP